MNANVLRYAGYVYDAESGLYYCSARYYDPQTMQFLTKDIAKADAEESAYQYCGGDPVGKVDPSGERAREYYTVYKKVTPWSNYNQGATPYCMYYAIMEVIYQKTRSKRDINELLSRFNNIAPLDTIVSFISKNILSTNKQSLKRYYGISSSYAYYALSWQKTTSEIAANRPIIATGPCVQSDYGFHAWVIIGYGYTSERTKFLIVSTWGKEYYVSYNAMITGATIGESKLKWLASWYGFRK